MQVTITDGYGRVRHARLAPVTGSDELGFGPGSNAADAIALLRRALRGADGGALDLDSLDVCHVDRLLAALYTAIYDDRAECRVACPACRAAYEFTIRLSELIAAQDADRPPPCDDGGWTLPDGNRLRPPTLGDLAGASDPGAVLARLVAGGVASDAATAWLERAAPVLSIELDAPCPDCGHATPVRFDLAAYFAARLAGERPFLLRETHLIAARYGWSRAEILSLGRDERRAYAGMIESERAAGVRLARRSA